jgi:hypothetical protein
VNHAYRPMAPKERERGHHLVCLSVYPPTHPCTCSNKVDNWKHGNDDHHHHHSSVHPSIISHTNSKERPPPLTRRSVTLTTTFSPDGAHTMPCSLAASSSTNSSPSTAGFGLGKAAFYVCVCMYVCVCVCAFFVMKGGGRGMIGERHMC